MVHHAPHDPPHFAPSAVPGRLLPLIRQNRGFGGPYPISHAGIVGSSTPAGQSVLTAAHAGEIYGDSFIHYALGMLNQPLGYVRDTSALAPGASTGGTQAGQYRHGDWTGLTLQSLVAPHALLTRFLDDCEAAAAAGTGVMAIVQIGENDIANGVSAATIFPWFLQQMAYFEGLPNVYPVPLLIKPRISGAGEDAKLVQRLAINQMVRDWCDPQGWPYIDCGDVRGVAGYMPSALVDSGNHARPPVGFDIGVILTDLLESGEYFTLPTGIDTNVLRASSIINNSEFAGVGAGVAPNGFQKVESGGPTGTISAVDYTDGSGRKWCRLTIATNGSNTGHVRLSYSSGTLTQTVNAGDVLEGFVEYRLPDPTRANLAQVRLQIAMGGSGDSLHAGGSRITLVNGPPVLTYSDRIVLSRSMPITARAGTTGGFLDARVFPGGGAGQELVIDIGTPMIVKNRTRPDYPS